MGTPTHERLGDEDENALGVRLETHNLVDLVED